MGWTAGQLQGLFNARAAIEFDLGTEFAARVIDTARYDTVIYAAIRAREAGETFALVLLAERRDSVLYTKPISEDMVRRRIAALAHPRPTERAQQRARPGLA